MRDEHGPDERWPVRAGLYDIVFALNLASAFAYGLLVCVIKRMTPVPPDDLCYFFLRAAARINRVLLLSPVPQVSTSGERHFPTIGEQLSRELVVLVSVLAATAIVYFLLKMIAGTHLHRVITERLLGPSLLFAAPLSYLSAMHNTSGVPLLEVSSLWGASYRSLVLVLGAEGLAAIIVSLARRIRPVPGWLLGALWLLHFGFWVPVLWSTWPTWEMWGDLDSYFGFFVPRALLIGWFLLAVIWALRLRRGKPGMVEAGARGMPRTLLVGATAVAMCAFVWLPHPVRSVADPSHRESVTVELSRSPCYGLCPNYSVRVYGNGSVEYTGDELVRVRGKATATLSTGQVTAILQKLESVGFFGIEDSAFAWGFDTPGIAVLVSVDGTTHRVSSDAWSTGAKSGTQAWFVHVANEIDQIIGSRQWVE